MSDDRPTFGSLFAGIGGIDLGLERAGWRGRWQVEWDGFCSADLDKNWPGLDRWGDITDVDFARVERVDLITGGFPCQPVSVAGKRRGRDDERWLWPEYARAIRVLRPRYVLVENVRNLLAIDDAGPFGEVLGTLAALGYDTEWDCLPASAFGAPHQRDRLFLLAYTDSEHLRIEPVGLRGSCYPSVPSGSGSALADAQRLGPARVADVAGGHDRNGHDPRWTEEAGRVGERRGYVADTDRSGLPRRTGGGIQAGARLGGRAERPGDDALANAHDGDAQGFVGGSNDAPLGEVPDQRQVGLRHRGRRDEWSTQSRVVRAPDGLPDWMDGHRWPAPPGPQYDWEPPRTIGRGVPNRAARIKALGNAVVPQVVEFIGRRILEAEGLR